MRNYFTHVVVTMRDSMDDVAEPKGPDPTTDSKVGGKPKPRKPGGIADQPTEPQQNSMHGRKEGRDKKRRRKETPYSHNKRTLTVIPSRG